MREHFKRIPEWHKAWREGVMAGDWFPVGDPGDTPSEAIARHEWSLLACSGAGRAAARDPEGDRVLFVEDFDGWPVAVDVTHVSG